MPRITFSSVNGRSPSCSSSGCPIEAWVGMGEAAAAVPESMQGENCFSTHAAFKWWR